MEYIYAAMLLHKAQKKIDDKKRAHERLYSKLDEDSEVINLYDDDK